MTDDLPQDNLARNSALEPMAYDMRPDDDGHVRVSIAISLKRIADSMDRQSEFREMYSLDDVPF